MGQTGKTPQERFRDHKRDHKAGRGIVRDYGQHLDPDPYENLNPVTPEIADLLKVALAERLRRQGHGV